MNGQTAKLAGIALAAVLEDDRSLAKVGRGLAPTLRGDLPRAIAPSDTEARRHHIAALLERVRPPLGARVADLPPRLLGLVSRRLPAEIARAVLRDGPRPRSGFTLPAGLAPAALRIARHHQEHGCP